MTISTTTLPLLLALTTVLLMFDVANPQKQDNGNGDSLTCSDGFREYCSACFDSIHDDNGQLQDLQPPTTQEDQQLLQPSFEGQQHLNNEMNYDCSLPGLQDFMPGQYEGVTVNYLSFVTSTSSPSFPIRAVEFQNCTGGRILFSEAANVWEDPIQDLSEGAASSWAPGSTSS